MLSYEELQMYAWRKGLDIYEADLQANDGLIEDNIILIDKKLKTSESKACVLAEEVGHYITGVGNIIDQTKVTNRKQERKGRIWAYEKQVGLVGLINAFNANCRNSYEIAEFLNVTEGFLLDAIEYYKSKYGCFTTLDNYTIYFYPSLIFLKMF